MKRINTMITIIALAILTSCGGNDKKDKSPDNAITNPDTIEKSDNTKRPAADKIPDKTGPSTTTGHKPDKNEILANIDQYLVSKASFTTPPGADGISNAGVSVQNTLPDITFQKAILEVSIMLTDGAEFRTDYYVLQNIEPADIKTVKVPNAARGNSIVCHVVKLKSTELTDGEMLLVGSHFVTK